MRAWIGLAFLLCAQVAGAATDPRRALAEGERAFIKTNMAEAAQLFSTAAVQAATAKLDPAVAHYNHGLALLADGQASAAAEQFQTATRTTDLTLQRKAFFNRGNALCQLAADLEKGSQLQPALQSIQEAQAMYEKTLMLDPRDRDAKVNYELAGRARERLEQMQPPPPPSGSEQSKDDQQKEDDQEQPPSQQDQEQPQPSESDQQEQQQQENPSTAADNPSSEENQEQEPRSGQDMTREEAVQLLDGMKEQEQATREQMARDRMRLNMGRLPPVDKDW